MYHSIIPVTEDHNPIVVESSSETHVLIFNAGPSTIQAQVWLNWKGKVEGSYDSNSKEPNFILELRPGNEKVVAGSLVRVAMKKTSNPNEKHFAAVGATFLYWPIN